MAGYSPLKITGMTTGLVQERENFLLPDDAYPVLQNAYVWRERILRKKGFQLLGRLQRNIGTTDAGGNAVVNITPLPIQTGIAFFQIGNDIFQDPGTTPNPGTQMLLTNSSGSATLNRITGVLTISGSQPLTAIQYFPGLPVMGIRIQEQTNSQFDTTIFFDQNYAYNFNFGTSQFVEFIPGTTWNAHAAGVNGTDFFWSTNYWTSGTASSPFGTSNKKLFWVTNNTGQFGASADPPRITDGTTWVNFFPSAWSQIDATNFLVNWLSMLPFRGRMVTFNTWEGTNATSAINYPNRIRWSTIGNPFLPYVNGVSPAPSTGSWRDDIRGQGGFLDIPTSEDIVSVGFVRDNLVIYCERSTWQLRYTGRSISPFQIERVNSELGTLGPFTSVQFDRTLVGVGDKGIVSCDSVTSERIDIKITDFVFNIQYLNNGPFRIQGIRDFVNRLAYWTIPYTTFYDANINNANQIFPNVRLVYNYENDSWATFNDSLTALGTIQPQGSRSWVNTHLPWIQCNFPWINQPPEIPTIVGGNQQGFVEYLNEQTVNDVSLSITNLTQSSTVVVTSPNHNMMTGFIIGISGIPVGSPFSNLNGGIFYVSVTDQNTFSIFSYNPVKDTYSIPVTGTPAGTYQGGGLINIRENFSIESKKFNFLDEGQNIQLGFIDLLMDATGNSNPGAISLNVYLNYDDSNVSNTLPDNAIVGTDPAVADDFFNVTIPTTPSTFAVAPGGSKFWQRVYCATRANFLTLQYTFSNAQMVGVEQQNDVQIDAQILWIRKGGRMTQL